MIFEMSRSLAEKVSKLDSLSTQKKKSEEELAMHDEKLGEELEKAERELEKAIMNLSIESSQANRSKERKAREKVSSLRLELSGSSERRQTVSRILQRDILKIKEEVMSDLSAELKSHKNTFEQGTLDRIRLAKKEYLDALKAHHELIDVQCRQTYFDVARSIGETASATSTGLFDKYYPNIYVRETTFRHTPNGNSPYGIGTKEIQDALSKGIVPKSNENN
ncbi:hypothetical protein [Bacillus sp. FSL K6-2971]|uniref:hypothetical protein n=1 Tax=Bacillus sp. FSL K6-2971 TaxID=2921487 RepID=UPI0030F903AE